MLKSCAAIFFLVAAATSCHTGNCDEAAVRKTLADYVNVFNQKAVDQVGSFWTASGTHIDRETGERTEGRDAIQADISEVLKTQPNIRLSARIDRFRMVTATVASVEGQTTVVLSDAEPIVSAFTALMVYEGDRWLLDSIEEMSLPQPEKPGDALGELQWLIGDWIEESGDIKVSTTFRWTANQAFLLRSFNVQTQDEIEMSGTQIIGWDPFQRQIRSWTFNSDGSFGEATWVRDGSNWLSKSQQTLPDGSTASGTYVLGQLDDNSFTMQLLGHEQNGEPQPAGPMVKIVRAQTASTTSTELKAKQQGN